MPVAISELDNAMIELDGTENKQRAWCQRDSGRIAGGGAAAAVEPKKPLYEYIAGLQR
jgi:enolase